MIHPFELLPPCFCNSRKTLREVLWGWWVTRCFVEFHQVFFWLAIIDMYIFYTLEPAQCELWTKTCQCGMPGIIPGIPGIIPAIPGIIPAIPGIIAMAFVALWQLQWHLRGTNAQNPRVFCSIFFGGQGRERLQKISDGWSFCGKKVRNLQC